MGRLRRLGGRCGLLRVTRVQVALAVIVFSVALTAEDCSGATTTGVPSTSTSTATATATPLPTETPSRAAPQQAQVTFPNGPASGYPGQTANLTAHYQPGVSCGIVVHYKSGPSRAQGLTAKTTSGARQVELRAEQHCLRQLAAERPQVETDLGWCEAAIVNLIDGWDHADSGQRARLMAGIYESVEVAAPSAGDGPVEVLAIPRADWAPFFKELSNRVSLERETSLELATSTLATLRSTN